ncbi:2-oxoacid:acceptor oxidoreductase [Sphaerochaeta sp. PS]|uniref:2-oxoacid:acceptor oxidoreductase n=1 Tax=Sphaerochaeta sp. PS TaxID=3076336 RepID=UPI0028A33718|nr:2-oxoacid:acceptor oxidoreductase [Sphaerochaeta sp. PS]MDT4761861.1 2-oxoacid:acceptor oxidoreductase [Sphaerochaeta sp. PS]
MSKRNDAIRIYEVPTYKQIFPYIMPKRCDSLVYQNMVLDLTNAVAFIKQNKRPDGSTYRIFELFIAALMRTISLRPELNRFVANYKYWQRTELSVNFIVKEDYKDDAPEHSMPLYFTPEMTLPEISKIIDDAIIAQREPANENFTDKAILFFMGFPNWFIKMLVGLAGFLDRKGNAPKALRDADGLHTTIFISNMGSIGLGGGSPHHHLYEWGTTSLFATMGILRRVHKTVGDVKTHSDTMEVGFTVDERITDGFYFTKSIKLLQDLLNEPVLLTMKPTLPPPPLTKKEYKRKRKASKLR